MTAERGERWPLLDFRLMPETAIAASDTADWIAVLPLGATEQHGPHLPKETDTLIAEGLVDRLSKQLPAEAKVTFLPVERVGYSPEHLDYEESESLAFDVAVRRWVETGERLSRLGIRKLLLLNAHGGNSPLVTITASELRQRDMLCVATSWLRFGRPEGLIDDPNGLDIHGGAVETSVMLALYPELVDMKKAADFSSDQEKFLKENKYLSAYGKHAFGWKIQDLNPVGAVGNATSASAEIGEKLIEHAIAGLLALLGEIERFDLNRFDRPPAKK